MKIYQIHKYGGECEDAYDYIIGSYLLEHRANEEMEKAKALEEVKWKQSKKCQNCPFIGEDNIEELDIAPEEYCPHPAFFKEKWGQWCEKYNAELWKPSFYIKEVEVEE